MTWRAFIIGLLAVFLIAAITPYNDFDVGNTYITGCHFPPGAFFIVMLLTFGVNILIKLVRRAWAFRQAELMLIFCMMLVASTVPASGLMRFWFSMQVAPAYYRDAGDLPKQKDVLAATPDSLVLTKNPRSVAVLHFFEARPKGEPTRLYLERWIRPMASWMVFLACFYLGTVFLGGLLRKQWVDVERLSFPLARVPLDITEGAGERRLLPEVVRSQAFILGVLAALAFALVRVWPVFMGKEQGWLPTIELGGVLWGTPFGNAEIWWARLFPLAVGVAFLVPTDVTLSVWLFFMFTRLELQASHWMGRPIQGGSWGDFMQWQQAGAFVVFTLLMFWAARRHLLEVARRALLFDRSVDDSQEPIGYRLAFWGAALAWTGMFIWLVYYKVHWLTAVGLLGFMLCIMLVHARVVCQGGIFFTQHTVYPPTLINVMSGSRAFPVGTGAVVALLQNAVVLQDAREILSGHAMNALRIASVFRQRRRWFLPAMLVALTLALVVGTVSTLWTYYGVGGLNIPNDYGIVQLPKETFQRAGRIIAKETTTDQSHYVALAMGAGIMFVATVMRARLYWWPLHSVGFLIGSTWPMHNLYFSFFVAWISKVLITKFFGGSVLRGARRFFLGVIIGEAVAIAVCTIVGLVFDVKFGYLFMPE
jgi:hypothetical protein